MRYNWPVLQGYENEHWYITSPPLSLCELTMIYLLSLTQKDSALKIPTNTPDHVALEYIESFTNHDLAASAVMAFFVYHLTLINPSQDISPFGLRNLAA
jgi:hypothetical protein